MAAAAGARATFREGHVKADGIRIRYWEAGKGESVVMVGDMTWGLTVLHHALAVKNRVVAFELPGLGASPGNKRSQSARELAGTMAHAAGMAAPNGHTLIGNSFGANVALWQALQAPNKVEALILISPTAILPTTGAISGPPEQIIGRLFAHPEKVRGLMPPDPAMLAKEEQLTRRLKGETHDAEAERKLGEIQCPTLVVFGLADTMVAPQAASIYREKVPNCNISMVYDAGHVIVAERPEALINAVSDFVQRRETFIVGHRTGVINP